MDNLIQISKLNDFLYSPKSLYFHSAFEDFNTLIYHETAQQVGRENHKNIDSSKYSSQKDILQAITVYSEKLDLIGKIDLYDQKTKTLTERKTQIKQIFEGYKMQLYAQYFCMLEMGYKIDKIELYSLKDNKKYPLPLPGKTELKTLTKLVLAIQNYNPIQEFRNWADDHKDQNTIYNTLYF